MAAEEAPEEAPEPANETGLPDVVERRALVYASALGTEFDFHLLAAGMDVAEEPLAEALERLVARGLLREKVGGDRFAFVDDARRSQIYRTLSQSRLRVVHRRIAEAMERLGDPPDPALLPELGRHFFLGRDPARSYRYNLAAADLADARGDPAGAAIHLERARLDAARLPGRDPSEDTRLAERLGRLYFAMGDLKAAARLFADSLEETDPADRTRRASLWIARSRVAGDLKDTDAAVASAHAARALYQGLDDASGMAVAHRILSRLSYDRGRFQEALDEGMLALELLRHTSDDAALGALSVDLGNTFRELDPMLLDEAVAWYDRGLEQLVRARDDRGIALAHLERGRALAGRRPIEALDDLAKSRAAADRLHDPVATAWALLEGVPIRLLLGHIAEAERDNQLAESLLKPVDAPEARMRVRIQSGLLREREGRWEEAERAYRQVVDSAARRQDPAAQAEAQFFLARLYAKTRDLERARTAYLEAARLKLPRVRRALAPAFEELGRQLEGEPARPEGSAAPRAL